jgi:hypothetical protein
LSLTVDAGIKKTPWSSATFPDAIDCSAVTKIEEGIDRFERTINLLWSITPQQKQTSHKSDRKKPMLAPLVMLNGNHPTASLLSDLRASIWIAKRIKWDRQMMTCERRFTIASTKKERASRQSNENPSLYHLLVVRLSYSTHAAEARNAQSQQTQTKPRHIQNIF